MPNFAFEFHLGDNELNSLCYASWLLDHDMFEVHFIQDIYF